MTADQRTATITRARDEGETLGNLSFRLGTDRRQIQKFMRLTGMGYYARAGRISTEGREKGSTSKLDAPRKADAKECIWSRAQLLKMDRKATLAMLKHHPKLASADLRRAILKAQEAA